MVKSSALSCSSASAVLLATFASCAVDNGQWMKADAAGPLPDAGAPTDAATTDLPVVLPADLMTIAADNPNVQYTGRFDVGQFVATATTFPSVGSPTMPVASLGGSQATVRFMGTAVGVLLAGHVPDYFDAFVDGQMVAKLTTIDATAPYPIAANLSLGEHVVSVVKRTESNFGRAQFLGFVIKGDLLPPPARPARRIEIIGDSITAGFGMDAPNGDPLCQADGQGQPTEDSPNSFGALVARALQAEYQLIGVSGIGLMRNYQNTYDPRTMPQQFDLLFPQPYQKDPGPNSPTWDPTHTLWVPDAILIALGTNDFGAGNPDSMPPLPPKPDAPTFSAAYIAFVTTLRTYYPNAHIFGITSPVERDPNLEAGINMTVAHFPDGKVHAITIPAFAGLGCTTHPSAAQHMTMAKIIGPAVQTAMGW